MHDLKRISKAAIPDALEKALRYRLLNEPLQAQSICRDIVEVEPDNQQALITLLLSLTDQFATGFTDARQEALQVLEQLKGDYQRFYYEGIIHERWAQAQADKHMPSEFSSGWYLKAMQCYEKADMYSPEENPDAALRWNTCARMLARKQPGGGQAPQAVRDVRAEFGDDVPLR